MQDSINNIKNMLNKKTDTYLTKFFFVFLFDVANLDLIIKIIVSLIIWITISVFRERSNALNKFS